MFYLIEIKNWHHGFSYAPQITRDQLLKIIQSLLKQGFLIDKEKGYLLTNKGQKHCDDYFKQHYYPQKIDNFTYANVKTPFWNSYQLLTQVFSELSYENNQYNHIIKHSSHQENVQQMFKQFRLNNIQLLNVLVNEHIILLKNITQYI